MFNYISSDEYMTTLSPVEDYMRRESEIPKLLAIIKKGGGHSGIERPLGQLLRLLAKAQLNDYQCFWYLDGLGILAQILSDGIKPFSGLSRR